MAKSRAKIKILFVDHTPFAGGAQLALARDIAFLDRTKFQPFLVIDKNSNFEKIYSKSKVKIYKTSFGRLKQINPAVLGELAGALKDFYKIVDAVKPDIVVANTTRALILAGLIKDYRFGMKLLKRSSLPTFKLVSYIRDYDYDKWLFHSLRLSVDKFLFVSQSVQDHYKEKKPKAEVVYLGSDVGKFKVQNSKLKVEIFKDLMGIKKGDFVIGFAGRLVDWKGPLFLLEAFKKVKDKNLKLIFFGTGKNQPGDMEEKLRREVRRNNLEENVLFAGFTEDQNLIYSSINCFVLPSLKNEPFATNVIEAALSNLPIIATYTGGTPEFIKSGKNGLLVKPKDVNQLAKALLRISTDRALAKSLAKNALKDAQSFKEEKFVQNLEKIFVNMVVGGNHQKP